MRSSIFYVVCFLLFLLAMGFCIFYFLFPLVNNYLQISITVFAIMTTVFFFFSCLVTPGYLNKKVDGEFLLMLTRFDPKSLCPFCEVVQTP